MAAVMARAMSSVCSTLVRVLFGRSAESPEHDDQRGEEGRDADREHEEEQADTSQRCGDFGEDALAVVGDDGSGVLGESGVRHGLRWCREELRFGGFHVVAPCSNTCWA